MNDSYKVWKSGLLLRNFQVMKRSRYMLQCGRETIVPRASAAWANPCHAFVLAQLTMLLLVVR